MHGTPPRAPARRLDVLAPPSLLLFFWLAELLLPYLYALARHPWERQPGMMAMIRVEDIHLAFFAACLFLLCWMIGYACTRWTPTLRFNMREPKRQWPALRLVFNFAAVLALFILIYAVNPNSQFVSRMELTVGPWGKLLFLVIGLLFAAFWLSVVGLLTTNSTRLSLSRVVLALTLALCMILVFAPLQGRGRMLVAVLYMLVAWHYFVRPLSWASAWGVLAAGLLLAISLDYVRLSAQYSNIDPAELAYGLAYGRQFDGILNLAATLRAVSLDYAEFHHGAAWLADVMKDIGVDTAHPTSRTAFMTDVLRMPRYAAGFPLTRPGELFFAFGWPGVAIGALLMGALTRVWYNWMMGARPFGAASIPVYFTLLMTVGLVTQKNYMFSSLVVAAVYCVLILMLAFAAYGYRLTSWRRRLSWRPTESAPPLG